MSASATFWPFGRCGGRAPVAPSQASAGFRGPQQRRHRVTARDRLHKRPKVCEQCSVRRRQALSAATRLAHPIRRDRQDCFVAQFGQASIGRAARNARCPGHRRHAATAGSQRFGCCKTATIPLVQNRIKRFKPQPNGVIINHKQESSRADSPGESPKPKKSRTAIQLFVNRPLVAATQDHRTPQVNQILFVARVEFLSIDCRRNHKVQV